MDTPPAGDDQFAPPPGEGPSVAAERRDASSATLSSPGTPMLPLLLALAGDTLHVRRAERPPVLDGRADSAEYGAPDIRLANGQGTVLVWIRRVGDSVVVAAQIPDTSYYWGDDFVV